MKHAIELFSELGCRLRRFGEEDGTRRVVESACRENPWFTPADVRRAVAAICRQMLDRERLEAWLAHYPAPVSVKRNVLVIMAGNIPLVGFFDLLCVLASGHRCWVKPSAKDRVLMRYVVGLLLAIEPQAAVAVCDETRMPDAVIATGGENANRYFRTRYGGIPALLRGNRQSVAVLSGRETEAQLAGLADDIWAYSGLGCRSVSLLFLPHGYEPIMEMPRVNDKYRNNYRQSKALLEMTGQPYRDLGGAVLVEQAEFPTVLSRIACVRYDSLQEVAAWLEAHDGQLQCVVTDCLPHSRRVGFGQAQSPALEDYPDDVDVMDFLCGL